jgi:hypothetical protein
MLLEMDIVARQPPVPTAHTASTAPVVSPVITAPTAPTAPVASPVITAPTASPVPVVSPVITAPTASPVPVVSPVITAPTAPTVPVVSTVLKQLSPDRPEVLMQAYLAEKTAWLAQHPTVRPTEYRKARKWKNPRPKVLKEQSFYMPKERRDLNSNIITIKANWTNEEIIVWLDNEERKEEEEYNKL